MGFNYILTAHSEHRNAAWAMTASVVTHIALFLGLGGVNAEFRATAPYQSIEVTLSSVASPVSRQASEPRLRKDSTVSSNPSVSSDAPDNDKTVKPVQESFATAASQGEMVTRGTADGTETKQTDDYFSKLLNHIEGYKYYPRVARDRGLEGAVKVSFLLYTDGHIRQLVTDGGHVMLRRAAEQALQQALPLPLPAGNTRFPVNISYVMRYQLD